ncbi:ornithine cyclodeaminase family protein [Chengkuizengella axinellae]|uniref:Ornithine cyclodeaminase family protein n=1 Tax=Chengkuizengella axinellae TaxID=3064388 RepID=A0ABT9J1U8_9BACL|nr:hypothetical protein [Chengkuizengella sp. 2205SS18-9]MDP5275402.1 hypothetical protein [Chengkuizengella sp. 2205SS18-9]
MLFINQEEVKQMLTMSACIEIMEKVLLDLAKGEAIQPLRSVIPVDQTNLLGLMPGVVKSEEVIGTKLITIFPANHKKGLPSHQGIVVIFDSENGNVKTVVDGTEITNIRTAAVSGVATNYLAKTNAELLSMIGTGEQAKTHVEAMLLVRPIKQMNVWSNRKQKAIQFKEEMSQKYNIEIVVCDSVQETVENADIICTVTGATKPVLKGEWVKKGAHINAVGACRASDRELDSDLVKHSRFYVDRIESAENESGDYLIPLKEGVISKTHIIGEIGQLITKKIEGRIDGNDITVFESLGLAVEDVAVAEFLYKKVTQSRKEI